MTAIISLSCGGRICIRCRTRSTTHYIPRYNLFGIDLSKVVLTHNLLKTFVKGIFIKDNLNVNNYAASVVSYSSNIDHVTESSSNGDPINTDEV